jgi:hypothetical protein
MVPDLALRRFGEDDVTIAFLASTLPLQKRWTYPACDLRTLLVLGVILAGTEKRDSRYSVQLDPVLIYL